MTRVIWNRAGNPTRYVSDRLGISERDLGRAIHSIKAASNLRGAAWVIVYDDGAVTDAQGEPLGNVYDEI